MAREYKKRSNRKHRRGLKPGHTKSVAWRKAISEGMKRYHRSGKKKHRRRSSSKKYHSTGKRRKTQRYYRRSKTEDGGFSVKWHKRRKRRA